MPSYRIDTDFSRRSASLKSRLKDPETNVVFVPDTLIFDVGRGDDLLSLRLESSDTCFSFEIEETEVPETTFWPAFKAVFVVPWIYCYSQVESSFEDSKFLSLFRRPGVPEAEFVQIAKSKIHDLVGGIQWGEEGTAKFQKLLSGTKEGETAKIFVGQNNYLGFAKQIQVWIKENGMYGHMVYDKFSVHTADKYVAPQWEAAKILNGDTKLYVDYKVQHSISQLRLSY